VSCVKKFAATLKYMALLLPVAAVAGTAALYRYGSPLWQLYVMYALQLVTHPLIVLFLLLTMATLAVAIVLRRRHRSELLGFCFLLSAVLHLLTVAFFSLWLVEHPIAEVEAPGGRRAVMTGLPSFAESTVGEDLRGLLQQIAAQDRRTLDERAAATPPSEPPLGRAASAVSPPEQAPPAPARQPIPVAEATAEQHPVDAQPTRVPTALPAPDTTKLVRIEPLANERPPEPRPPAPAATLALTPAVTPLTPLEPATPVLPVPATDRVSNERPVLTPDLPTAAGPRVDATLQPSATVHTLDELAMRAPGQEAAPVEPPAPVKPVARDVSASVRPVVRSSTPVSRPNVQAPERDAAPTPLSAIRLDPTLPAAAEPVNAVTEQGADVRPAPFANTRPLELSVAAPLLPTASEAPPATRPPRAAPRTLEAARTTGQPIDRSPMQSRPAVDTPTVDVVPLVTPAPAVAARPLQVARVADGLSDRPQMRPAPPAPAAMGRVTALPDQRDPAPTPVPQPAARTIEPVRGARVALPDTDPRHPTPDARQARPTPDATPRADSSAASSLADAGSVPTAAPTVTPPTAEASPLPPAAPRIPATITVDVGGRLMLVEASPLARALRPAALTSRDVEAAYRPEATTGVAPLPDAIPARPASAPRVSQRSLAAADSIRLLQPPEQTPTVATELARATPGARPQTIDVGRLLTAIVTPATGTVAQTQVVVDTQSFAQDRVARYRPAAEPRTPAPAHRATTMPTTRATDAAPVTFEAQALPSPAADAPRATPRAADELHPIRGPTEPDRALPPTVVGRIAETAFAAPGRAAPAPAVPRNIQTPGRAALPAPDVIGQLPVPAATGEAVRVARASGQTWAFSAPAGAERSMSIDAAAATSAAGLPAQPTVRLEVPAAPAAIAAPTPPRNDRPTISAADGMALDIARAAFGPVPDSAPEAAVPPPRTTFLASAASLPSVATRLPPTANAGSTPAADPARAADISDRLSAPKRYESATHALPVMDVAARPVDTVGVATASPARRAATPARELTFDLARAEALARPTVSRATRRAEVDLPQPEVTDRVHARVAMELGRPGDSRATVVDDRMPGAEAPSRALIAAEVAATRESPSKKAIYQLRSSRQRKEHIEELGGSAQTEEAVEQALDWLAGAQSADGRWDVDNFEGADACGGRGNQANADVGITGLTLLAFLGAGYTHVGGKHQAAVTRAIDWLMAGLQENGDLRRGGQMYDQAMATAALCETLSLTGDARLRPAAERAVKFILSAQNPEAAWRYNPREDNDTSVTGWQILALKSAEVAGIHVPPQHYRWTEKWLDTVRRGEQGGLYLYRAGHAVTPVMTAEGWFCQLFMGEQSNPRGQEESIAYVMEHLPVWSRDIPGAINFYYWYYATLSLHLSGAETFGLWNDALTTALLRGRVSDGPAAGTWDPISHVGVRGGRIYSTAMATLCLEVYYRFLPFYKLK
jgi:hypothetical protein